MQGKQVVLFTWRDTFHPEGGGAEIYLQQIAWGLRDRGAEVTIFTAAHAEAPASETRDGIRYVRRGSKISVYLHAMFALMFGTLGKIDLVVDVQNGLPFFTRLLTRSPVVVLVHHVHREQWPIVFPGLIGKIGWLIERTVAPRLYRNCTYVAVSSATKKELVGLGVDSKRVRVIHNGTATKIVDGITKSAEPTVCVVGRLVPHKQVEVAIDAVLALRPEFPEIRLTVIGDGWWAEELKQYAQRRDAGDSVIFTGQISELDKQRAYAESWVMALPSLKEGWGLVVGEAGAHETPAVAFRSAGGTQESVHHTVSGILVDSAEEFTAALRQVIADPATRQDLARGALAMSKKFTWTSAQDAFANVVANELSTNGCSDTEAVELRRPQH